MNEAAKELDFELVTSEDRFSFEIGFDRSGNADEIVFHDRVSAAEIGHEKPHRVQAAGRVSVHGRDSNSGVAVAEDDRRRAVQRRPVAGIVLPRAVQPARAE